MELTSSAFGQGEAIPSRYTCEGDDVSPQLSWKDVPQETKCLVLIVHDPDAPRAGGFTHWLVYNIPSTVSHLEENIAKQPKIPGGGLQGKNDAGRIGYMGPCPPSGRHHYLFQLYALNRELSLDAGATHDEVATALQDYILAKTELVGTYIKKGQRAA